MKRRKKRLPLNRTTIRQLDANRMDRVNGGTVITLRPDVRTSVARMTFKDEPQLPTLP